MVQSSRVRCRRRRVAQKTQRIGRHQNSNNLFEKDRRPISRLSVGATYRSSHRVTSDFSRTKQIVEVTTDEEFDEVWFSRNISSLKRLFRL